MLGAGPALLPNVCLNQGDCQMPAASYREGPDGHSSRKQNSKRRRAKCSPSFVSGRVIGHGDIPPRCVPGRSTMAKCSRNAFPGGNPWQVLRSMHPKSWFGRENRQFVAAYCRRVFKMSWLWQDMRAMHPKSPANRLSGTHGVKVLPGKGSFRCTGPSNHARRANLAIL